MSSRAVWSLVLALCLLWIIAAFAYAHSSGSGPVLPLLLAVPAVILAKKVAWQRVRRV